MQGYLGESSIRSDCDVTRVMFAWGQAYFPGREGKLNVAIDDSRTSRSSSFRASGVGDCAV